MRTSVGTPEENSGGKLLEDFQITAGEFKSVEILDYYLFDVRTVVGNREEFFKGIQEGIFGNTFERTIGGSSEQVSKFCKIS